MLFPLKKYAVTIGLIGVSVFIVSSSVWATKMLVSQNPLPLGTPEGVEYTLPQNLPVKTGGPYKNVEDVQEIAVLAGQAKGELKPVIKNIFFTTHGDLVISGIFSKSYSVADNREVYFGILEGNFQFNRVRPGMKPIQSQQMDIEIDATTGEVLTLGTSEFTEDSSVINNLRLLKH